MKKIAYAIVPQKAQLGQYQQLSLDLPSPLHEGKLKPQISSISGISPKERHRYQLKLGDRVLGDWLTLDEALKLMALAEAVCKRKKPLS
jgi:hypothetical protein